MNSHFISSIATLFLWVTTFSKSTEKKTNPPTTPNFVVIVADDAGWNDVSYNGSEIHTPTIDWLAKMVQFTTQPLIR